MSLQIEALVLENAQLKKNVGELKQILSTCRTSVDMSSNQSQVRTYPPSEGHSIDGSMFQVDHILFREFTCWNEQPSMKRDASLFMHRVYNEDILPCLIFPNADVSSTRTCTRNDHSFRHQLSAQVLTAIEDNNVIIEACHSMESTKYGSSLGASTKEIDTFGRMCSLIGELCQCAYRIRLGDDSPWYSISRLARNRVRIRSSHACQPCSFRTIDCECV